MKRMVVLLASLAILAACSDGLTTEPEIAMADSLRSGLMLVDSSPGKCLVYPTIINNCAVGVTMSVPLNFHCGWNCDPNPAQTAPISFVFSKPVYQADVTYHGAFTCTSNDLGHVEFYARGMLVETGVPIISYPDDCGQDSITSTLEVRPTYVGSVDSIVIHRAMPDSFVLDWPPYEAGAVGQTHASYYFWLLERREPTATCLTGDDLLDQQVVRDLLKSVWDSSLASLPLAQRREVGGYLFEDNTGTLSYVVYPDPNADPCFAQVAPTFPLPGRVVGMVHTHPMQQGDLIPSTCTRIYTPGRPKAYDTKTYNGASGSDMERLANDNDYFSHLPGYEPFPMFIVDSLELYKVPPGANIANGRTVVQRWLRHDATQNCHRL